MPKPPPRPAVPSETHPALTAPLPARNTGGRPPKLTAQARRSILASLARGNYLSTAADVARVSADTVRGWLERGQREKAGPYFDFYLAVRQAQGAVQDNLVGVFHGGAENDPNIAKEFLARRWPKQWGTKVNGEQPPGPIVPIQIIFRTRGPDYDPMAVEVATAPGPAVSEGATPETFSASPLRGLVEVREP